MELRRVAPSAMTFLGLLLAFLAITAAIDGHYERAAWLVFAATMADTFDGAVARVLSASSPFGVQLDSLVDLVAAGVAPAVLARQVYFADWGLAGTLLAAGWVGLVAARLARFNAQPVRSDMFFAGVPCPVGATILTQYLLVSRAVFDSDGNPWVATALIGSLGCLMLSDVPYWKSSTIIPPNFTKYAYGPGTVVTFVALPFFPNFALTVGLGASLVVAAAKELLAMRARVSDPGVTEPGVAF